MKLLKSLALALLVLTGLIAFTLLTMYLTVLTHGAFLLLFLLAIIWIVVYEGLYGNS